MTETHACPTCGKEFTPGEKHGAERRMKLHYSKAHGESIASDSRRECPECGLVFWSQSRIDAHREDVHQSGTGNTDCPTCGAVFETRHGMKVHHVQAHGESLARKEKSCENCGERFSIYNSKDERGRGRFCSRECYNDFRSVDTECSWCGVEITVDRHRAEKYDRIFCSNECDGAWKSEHRVGDDHPQYDQVELRCEACGDEFTRPPAHIRGQNSFCSPECRADWMAENFVGEDHPCWTGGSPEYYGENWRQNRREALERDNYECRICGVGDEQHRDQLGQGLDVHHIQPIRTFDELEEANRLDNLVTLCRGCHSRWEGVPLFPTTGGEANV